MKELSEDGSPLRFHLLGGKNQRQKSPLNSSSVQVSAGQWFKTTAEFGLIRTSCLRACRAKAARQSRRGFQPRGRMGEGGGMARSAWSAARPGGHHDTTRSVTSPSLASGFTRTPKKRSGLRRMDVAGGTRSAPLAALARARLEISPTLAAPRPSGTRAGPRDPAASSSSPTRPASASARSP